MNEFSKLEVHGKTYYIKDSVARELIDFLNSRVDGVDSAILDIDSNIADLNRRLDDVVADVWNIDYTTDTETLNINNV